MLLVILMVQLHCKKQALFGKSACCGLQAGGSALQLGGSLAGACAAAAGGGTRPAVGVHLGLPCMRQACHHLPRGIGLISDLDLTFFVGTYVPCYCSLLESHTHQT